MGNNNLILRAAISPYGNDTTLNRILDWLDVDNNFINLKGNDILSAVTSGTTLQITKFNGNTFGVDLSGIIPPPVPQNWTTGSTGNYSIRANNNSELDSIGNYSVAEGYGTLATGDNSHAEGSNTHSINTNSHAEGQNTTTFGSSSHAEGNNTTTVGSQSHAEGNNSLAYGDNSHAEGLNTSSIGNYSHAEGSYVTSIGTSSHAEGNGTTAGGNYSHAEGAATTASGNQSHSEGAGTIAYGSQSHSEGDGTQAIADNSHAEGGGTVASGSQAHSEGGGTTSSGVNSHSEGGATQAIASNSHAEGGNTIASGSNSHSEGGASTASGDNSHAEGYGSIASGSESHAEGNDSIASGSNSHAEGDSTTAYGYASHAEGNSSTASGNTSHAEGSSTTAYGYASHAEGSFNLVSGDNSHAEGSYNQVTADDSHGEGSFTTASGNYSHTEGFYTSSSGIISHAEGEVTKATGEASHSEGYHTAANGYASHSEGQYTLAQGESSHAEGNSTKATGQYSSHAEGISTTASGANGSHAEGISTMANGINGSHAEGNTTTASGDQSHAEGENTIASGNTSHAEGNFSTANGYASHSEGQYTLAQGESSHAEGTYTTASGNYSHAEGEYNTTIGLASHGEGYYNTANGNFSHVEGFHTQANGVASHAEGQYTTASGVNSHAEGYSTTAIGEESHAEGNNNVANGANSHAEGSYNQVTADNSHVGGAGNTSNGNNSFVHSDTSIINSGATDSVILGGNNNTVNSNVTNSIILGGHNITATDDDTIYGPNANFKNNVIIGGNLTILGSAITANTETVLIKDNILTLNYGEVSNVVSSGIAGIEIDRGSGNKYDFIFVESAQTFNVGMSGNTQPVATREDNPLTNGIAVWDSSTHRFNTSYNLSATTISATTFYGDGSQLGGIAGSNFSRIIYVDSNNGSDTVVSNRGQLGLPFKTLEGVVNAISGGTIITNYLMTGDIQAGITILNCTNVTSLHVGQTLTHPNIPFGSIITNITGTTVTMSETMVAASGVTIKYWTPYAVLCQGEFYPDITKNYLIDGIKWITNTNASLYINNFHFLYSDASFGPQTSTWGILGNWKVIGNGNIDGNLIYFYNNYLATPINSYGNIEFDSYLTYGNGWAIYLNGYDMSLVIKCKTNVIAKNGYIMRSQRNAANIVNGGLYFEAHYAYGNIGGINISAFGSHSNTFKIDKLEAPSGVYALTVSGIPCRFYGLIQGDVNLTSTVNFNGLDNAINIYGDVIGKLTSIFTSTNSYQGQINIFGNAQVAGSLNGDCFLNVTGDFGLAYNTFTINDEAILSVNSFIHVSQINLISGKVFHNNGNLHVGDASYFAFSLIQSGGIFINRGTLYLSSNYGGIFYKTGGDFVNEGDTYLKSYDQNNNYSGIYFSQTGGNIINKGNIYFLSSVTNTPSVFYVTGGNIINQGTITNTNTSGSNTGTFWMYNGAKYQSYGGKVFLAPGRNLFKTDSSSRTTQILTGYCNVVGGISLDNSGNTMTDEIGGTLIENTNLI
jgi:hypothetical protein